MALLSGKSDLLLQILWEHPPDGVLGLNPAGKITFANPTALQWLRYSENELTGSNFTSLLTDDKTRTKISSFIRNKPPNLQLANTALKKKDGDILYAEINLVSLTSEDSEVTVVFIHDVSRKYPLTLESVKENILLSSIFNAIEDGIFLLDRDLNIIRANTYMKKKFSKHAPIKGKKCYEIYQDQAAPCPGCPARITLKEGVPQSEILSYPMKGTPKGWMELHTYPVRDRSGNISSVVGYMKDITEQKKLSDQLAESERRFRGFFENSAVFAYFSKKNGATTRINQAALDLLGYKKDEFQRLNTFDLYDDPEERNRFINEIEARGFVKDFPIHLKCKDGRVLSCLDTAVLIKDNQGRPVIYQGIIRDVTEWKWLKTALAESETKFRDFFESVPVFAYLTSSEGRLLETNEAGARLFGYSTKELLQMNVANLYKNPDDRLLFSEKMKKEKIVEDYPVLLRRKDGGVISCRITASARKNARGDIVGYQGFIRDVTEQERLQKTLSESEAKFRTFFQSPAVCAYFTDEKEGHFDVNDAFLKLLGYSKKEISALKPSDLYKDSRERKEEIKILKRQGFVRDFPIHLRRKNGKIISCLDTASVTGGKQGNHRLYQGIIRDVTEQEKKEKELNRLHILVSQTEAEIVITDINGIIEYVNPAFEKITGYSARDAIGQNPRLLKSGQHDEAFYKNLWETIITGKSWNGRFINKRRDGTLFHEEAHIFPITDIEGRIVNFAAIKREITREVMIEEQLKQASQLEAIGRLTGGVAHDFNNILTIIRGNAEAALKNVRPETPLYKEISGILKASMQATRVTSQLLAFSRKQIIRPRLLAINHVLMNLRSTLDRIVEEDIDFQYTLCETGDTVYADLGQIEQCILNLVINAQDAIRQKNPQTEKKITIETKTITINAQQREAYIDLAEGVYVLITISDTGIGMDADTQEKIFEPFFTTKEPGEGTGLGSSTVFGIIKQNRGAVHVESEPGVGSTFKIFWPAAEGTPESDKPEPEILQKSTSAGESILVVEDDADIRKFVSQTLESFGYTVYSAGDGEEALAFVRSQKPAIDLLFTDVIMPKMGGEELAEALTRELPQLKIIFSSGYTDKHITRNGILGPNTHFLHKPYGLKALALKIREVLDKS